MWGQRRLMQPTNTRGFTMIEMLLVIVILSILAAVVIFAVFNIADRGRESACEIEVRGVNTAIEEYQLGDPLHAYPSALTASALFGQLEDRGYIRGSGSTATANYSPFYDPSTHSFSAACPS